MNQSCILYPFADLGRYEKIVYLGDRRGMQIIALLLLATPNQISTTPPPKNNITLTNLSSKKTKKNNVLLIDSLAKRPFDGKGQQCLEDHPE